MSGPTTFDYSPGETDYPAGMQSYQQRERERRFEPRQEFHRAHSHIGAGSAGHWIKMAGILSPLIIGELVKDSEKRWRLIRIASVATALAAEGMHTHRLMCEREECTEHGGP